MEEKYKKGDGVVIKSGSHSLQVGTKGVVVGDNGIDHPLYYDVAGISVIHPDRVVVNVLHVNEIEAF